MECWSVRWWRGAGVTAPKKVPGWGFGGLGAIRYRDASASNTDIVIKLRLDSVCLTDNLVPHSDKENNPRF